MISGPPCNKQQKRFTHSQHTKHQPHAQTIKPIAERQGRLGYNTRIPSSTTSRYRSSRSKRPRSPHAGESLRGRSDVTTTTKHDSMARFRHSRSTAKSRIHTRPFRDSLLDLTTFSRLLEKQKTNEHDRLPGCGNHIRTFPPLIMHRQHKRFLEFLPLLLAVLDDDLRPVLRFASKHPQHPVQYGGKLREF